MGRPRTIDRDKILDAAEAIVRHEGATALTFDAVSRAAGITKGGLQYAFGSKDDLIAAMVDRWIAAFDAEVARNTASDAGPTERAKGYVLASQRMDEATQAKMAGLLVTLLQSPDYTQRARACYAAWIRALDPGSKAERRARTALLAAEGAFFLRSLGLVEMDQGQWDDVFNDISELL
jgi:AcrR family transcriptional regulator